MFTQVVRMTLASIGQNRLDQVHPIPDAVGKASSLKSYAGWCTEAVGPFPRKTRAHGRASSM